MAAANALRTLKGKVSPTRSHSLPGTLATIEIPLIMTGNYLLKLSDTFTKNLIIDNHHILLNDRNQGVG